MDAALERVLETRLAPLEARLEGLERAVARLELLLGPLLEGVRPADAPPPPLPEAVGPRKPSLYEITHCGALVRMDHYGRLRVDLKQMKQVFVSVSKPSDPSTSVDVDIKRNANKVRNLGNLPIENAIREITRKCLESAYGEELKHMSGANRPRAGRETIPNNFVETIVSATINAIPRSLMPENPTERENLFGYLNGIVLSTVDFKCRNARRMHVRRHTIGLGY